MCSGSEAGTYLRLIDFVYQLESNKEDKEVVGSSSGKYETDSDDSS